MRDEKSDARLPESVFLFVPTREGNGGRSPDYFICISATEPHILAGYTLSLLSVQPNYKTIMFFWSVYKQLWF